MALRCPMAMGVSKVIKVHNWYQGRLSKHSKFLQDMIWEV